MMKMKSFMTMMAVAAIMMGMSSCGSDDSTEAPVAVAAQVAGSYSGDEVVKVNNEDSSNETRTYVFTKATDNTIDMVVPEVGMGMMTIPSVTVKGINLSKDGNTIKGSLEKYEGTAGDKAYTISNVTVLFNDKIVVVTFTEKYGKMPFDLVTTFTGTKK